MEDKVFHSSRRHLFLSLMKMRESEKKQKLVYREAVFKIIYWGIYYYNIHGGLPSNQWKIWTDIYINLRVFCVDGLI
jgi:hypothetical protein